MSALPPISALRDLDEEAWTQLATDLFPKALAPDVAGKIEPAPVCIPMNHASDKRFREPAMKLVSFECSAEEKAELRRVIDPNPSRREELQKHCLSIGIARELLPLTNALEATELIQAKCILEGIRIHPNSLVDRFEVNSWREISAEFQKVFPVQNGDWTSALEQVRQFVRDY